MNYSYTTKISSLISYPSLKFYYLYKYLKIMSINYCCIIAKKEKILLAESTTSVSSWSRITMLFQNIIHGKTNTGQVEIENDEILTYAKAKEIVLICRSEVKLGEEKPGRFLESFISLLKTEFGTLDYIIDKNKPMNTNCLQKRLGFKLDTLLKDFETGLLVNKHVLKDMNHEMEGLKTTMNQNIKNMLKENDNLDELLIKSKKLENDAAIMKQEAVDLELNTRCLRPWMAYSLIFLLVCSIVYVIFAIVKCGSLKIVCEGN